MKYMVLSTLVALLLAGCTITDISGSSGDRFIISFESNGGLVVPSIEVKKGKKAAKPDEPLRTNYTFLGWYQEEDMITPFNFQAAIEADITLYAKWVIKAEAGIKRDFHKTEHSAFGSAVDTYGDYVIAGAPESDSAGASSGAAYIIHWNGSEWTGRDPLDSSGISEYDFFGTSVAIYDQHAAVGAPGSDGVNDASGSVYVFTRDDSVSPGERWNVQGQTIAPTISNTGDLFGDSVAIYGDYLVVGAPGVNSGPAVDAGSAYVFRYEEQTGIWSQVATLTGSDIANDRFGKLVDIYDDRIAIGAPGNENPELGSGAVYIFKRNENNNWIEEQKLEASDAASGDAFGASLSIYGNYIAVGAVTDDTDKGTDSGSLYIFQYIEQSPDPSADQSTIQSTDGSWVERGQLIGEDTAAKDWFAYSLAMSSQYLVVGATQDDDNSSNDSGSVYVFAMDASADSGWSQVDKLTAPDAAADDYFGSSIAISYSTFVVGAIGDDGEDDQGEILNDSGSVVFVREYDSDRSER